MADLYVFNPGDSDDWTARREAEESTQRLVRARWTARIADELDLEIDRAEQAVAILFDHPRDSGDTCVCSCHPRFASLHDGGFDCSCTWSAERREQSREALFAALEPSPDMVAAQAQEEAEISAWLEVHPGVTAERTCLAAPEIWEGTVDGRSFFFRERHGEWRIEIDLVPDGYFAQRWVRTEADGEMVTEPVELTSGPEIAHGVESDLGMRAVDRLEFILRQVRGFIRAESCSHRNARTFCPDCGVRTDAT